MSLIKKKKQTQQKTLQFKDHYNVTSYNITMLLGNCDQFYCIFPHSTKQGASSWNFFSYISRCMTQGLSLTGNCSHSDIKWVELT